MSRRVDVDGVPVLVDGDTGPVVVLSSGLGGRRLHWTDTVANLARDHTVVRFDRPGTELTPDRRPTVRGEADRIAAALDAVRPSDSAVVVGHSVGGYYAEGFARLHPARTRALLLLDSSIAPPWRPTLPLPVKLAAARGAATLLDRLRLAAPLARAGLTTMQRRRPGGVDASTRSEIRGAAAEPGLLAAVLGEYVAYHELGDELRALRARCPLPAVPRTVVTGHTGWRTRRWRMQQMRLAETLGAQHVTVAPAGHYVMVEQPRRTADLIRAVGREVA